jgi:hypothetical protein
MLRKTIRAIGWIAAGPGLPFEWEEEGRAVVFRGLQTDERGTHRIYY